DLHFEAGSHFAQALPASHNAFIYVYRGELRVGNDAVPTQRMAILRNGEASDGVVLHADAPARALLIAGRPLDEPIAQYGPFVMNSKEEILQAVQDFQAGRFGA